jgi:hypothetical protein
MITFMIMLIGYDAINGINIASYDAMDAISSKNEIIEIPVTFVELAYVGGILDSIILHTDDILTVTKTLIQAEIATPPETITIERRNLLSHRVRKGTIRRLKEFTSPTTATSENIQSPPMSG